MNAAQVKVLEGAQRKTTAGGKVGVGTVVRRRLREGERVETPVRRLKKKNKNKKIDRGGIEVGCRLRKERERKSVSLLVRGSEKNSLSRCGEEAERERERELEPLWERGSER